MSVLVHHMHELLVSASVMRLKHSKVMAGGYWLGTIITEVHPELRYTFGRVGSVGAEVTEASI
jgi:hypothetical protein